MTDTVDENAGATPSEEPTTAIPEQTPAAAPTAAAPTPADEAPTMVQAAATPAVAPAAAGPRQSWFRKRWVLITGAAGAAVVLLLGGVAIGSTIGGHDGRDGHRGLDGPGQARQGGGGFGPQADEQGHGGFDRDGDGGFGQGGHGQGGDQFGQPQQGQPQQGQATPQAQSSNAPAQ